MIDLRQSSGKTRQEPGAATDKVAAGQVVDGGEQAGAADAVVRPGRARRRRHGVPPLLITADFTAVALGVLVASGARVWTAVLGGLLLALFGAAHLYRPRLQLSVLADLPHLVGRWLAALALTVLAQALVSNARWGADVIDWTLVIGATAMILAVVTFRTAAYAFVRRLRRRGLVAHRAVIVGAGRVGADVATTLLQHPEYGLRPVGFVDSDPLLGDRPAGLPVFGGGADLFDVLVKRDVRIVVVAFGATEEGDVVDLLRTCGRLNCEIFVVPRLFEVSHVDGDMDVVWGVPLVRLRRHVHRSTAWRVKRLLDVLGAAAALVALSPLLLAVAAAVRWEGGPGVLFRQERVGVDGQPFELLKFRSLKPVDDAESATHWNIAHDDRLGPVGRFIRRSSIDELPQLLNILRGDMSFVGPRPERPHFVQEFAEMYPRYDARHRVPSGLTGLAQVNGLRGDTSISERARFDNHYIENWSLWLDATIVLRTFRSVLRAEGA